MTLKYFLFHILFLHFAYCFKNQTFLGNPDSSIKNDNTVVWFEPFVSFQDTIELTKYNESLLIPLLQKVSTKFSAIMVHMTEDELVAFDWQYKTAAAVAQLNAMNNNSTLNSTPTLRLWISFHIVRPPIDDSPENSFYLNLLSKMAADANAIFPGSVHTLTVHISNQKQSNIKALLTRYKTIFNIMHRDRSKLQLQQRYYVGVMFDIEGCHLTGSLRIQLMSLVKTYTEVVFFDAITTSWHLTQLKTIDEAVHWFQDEIKQCKLALESVPSKKQLAHVGMLGGFPDTARNGDVSYSRLVGYWEAVANYGRETNTVVIMDRAFDTPYLLEVFEATRGWWRLKEDRKYENPYQYVFEDKEELAKETKEVSNLNENINSTWANISIEFHRNNVGVWAFPFSFNEASNYDTEIYKLFLTKISQYFQKILIGPVVLGHDYQLSTNLSKILIPTAELNTDIAKKLEIVLVFDVPVDTTDFNWKNLDVMKEQADKSNLIYENTTNLMLFNFGIDFDNFYNVSIDDIQTHLITRGSNEFNYGYGMMLSLDIWCLQETNLTIPFSNDRDSISTLAITAEVIWPTLLNGVGRYIRKFSIALESCRNRINTQLVNIDAKNQSYFDLVFILQWNDIYYGDSEIYKLADFVAFWEGLNDWALETNTTVILGQAFDSEDTGNGTTTKEGWWIVDQNKDEETISKQYKFEDKKSAIARKLREKREAEQIEQASSTILGTMEIIWISVGVIILLTISATMQVYVWRRYQLYQYISKEDINKFFKGVPHHGKTSDDVEESNENSIENQTHFNLPYNRQKYEVKRNDFKIDTDEHGCLGDGQFGIVQRAKVFKATGHVIQVAAKTTKHPPKKESILGLLSEIKILSFVGEHQCIIGLVGAYTAELHKGIVFVLMEYCQLGSLKNHLLRIKQEVGSPITQLDAEDSKKEIICDKIDKKVEDFNDSLDLLHLTDFLKWTSDIVSGMVYLASKHVVHADLAARNILLTIDRKVKIADFGLSRRMYNYMNYVKTGEEPLPWRWMAPESLRFSKFTEKSDVWSFGILLWEIYSLGETPYPGVFWDTDFANRLEDGLRLCKPSYIKSSTYSVMLQCWNINPMRRPTFIDVQALLDLYTEFSKKIK